MSLVICNLLMYLKLRYFFLLLSICPDLLIERSRHFQARRLHIHNLQFLPGHQPIHSNVMLFLTDKKQTRDNINNAHFIASDTDFVKYISSMINAKIIENLIQPLERRWTRLNKRNNPESNTNWDNPLLDDSDSEHCISEIHFQNFEFLLFY